MWMTEYCASFVITAGCTPGVEPATRHRVSLRCSRLSAVHARQAAGDPGRRSDTSQHHGPRQHHSAIADTKMEEGEPGGRDFPAPGQFSSPGELVCHASGRRRLRASHGVAGWQGGGAHATTGGAPHAAICLFLALPLPRRAHHPLLAPRVFTALLARPPRPAPHPPRRSPSPRATPPTQPACLLSCQHPFAGTHALCESREVRQSFCSPSINTAQTPNPGSCTGLNPWSYTRMRTYSV